MKVESESKEGMQGKFDYEDLQKKNIPSCHMLNGSLIECMIY